MPTVLCDNVPVAVDGPTSARWSMRAAALAIERGGRRRGGALMPERHADHHHHRQGPRAAVQQGAARAVVHGDGPAAEQGVRGRAARSRTTCASAASSASRRDRLRDDGRRVPRADGRRAEYARATCKLRDVAQLDRPLIVLIGGTTGVGKSTIATEVAHRLGITRISSTDSIREVMRGIFTQDLMPAIYESAFNAWRGLRVPVPQGANPVIVGFREQTAVVTRASSPSSTAPCSRAVSMVIEGVHLVPGYLDHRQFENARVVQLVIGGRRRAVAPEPLLHPRGPDRRDAAAREVPRRTSATSGCLGSYIEDLAREHGIPIIYSHQLDRTVADVLEHVVAAAIED